MRRTEDEFTSIGKWLKATQLDEIPQFINVLRGDMSLVGPRPIRPVFFEELARDLPAYWQRLIVRPGLTGLAQVRRGYETSMAEKLAHDLEWIADRSVRLYLRTVVATGWRVLRQSVRGSRIAAAADRGCAAPRRGRRGRVARAAPGARAAPARRCRRRHAEVDRRSRSASFAGSARSARTWCASGFRGRARRSRPVHG